MKAQKADLILWNGLNLERWFEKFFRNLRNVPSAVLTEGIEPIGIEEGPYTGKPNPHAWMSPQNAVDLRGEHPQGAGEDSTRRTRPPTPRTPRLTPRSSRPSTSRVRKKLERVPEDQRWLVTSEGAFPYLARSLGLKELFLWAVNADQQGTPQQVQKVIDGVRANKIPVVFSESTISDKPARQVAKETGARYGGVLYVDSLSDAQRPGADLSAAARIRRRDHRERPARRMSDTARIHLDVRNVTVTYPNGNVALRDATFRLDGGTICALVGVNGSGKSTLFKAIMGFVRPSKGDVRDLRRRPSHAAQKRNLVAYVPQSEEVDWTFPVSVWDVVMMGRYGYMNFLRIPRAEDRRIVEESLARVGMLDFRDRQIGELSAAGKRSASSSPAPSPSTAASSCSTSLSPAWT